MPLRLPYKVDCVSTKILSGPGAIASKAEAAINGNNDSTGNIYVKKSKIKSIVCATSHSSVIGVFQFGLNCDNTLVNGYRMERYEKN